MKYEKGQPVKQYKHNLLLILDEFPAFGKLETLEKAFGYTGGYGIRSMIVTQSINQVYKEYGKNTSIIDNCNIRIMYTPNDTETADWISRLLGTKTEIVEDKSYQTSFLKGMMPKSVTYSSREVGRPLLTPGEVNRFPSDNEILFVAGLPPIYARKVRYFKDLNFKKRLLNAPVTSDRIRDYIQSTVTSITPPAPHHERTTTTGPQTMEDDLYAYDDEFEVES